MGRAGAGGWWSMGSCVLQHPAPSLIWMEGHVGSEGLTEVHAACCQGRWLPAPRVGEAMQVWARPARSPPRVPSECAVQSAEGPWASRPCL